tara:strand:+ start:4184 stop:4798 length:615 start_codon:yes stop_codon:yes gene_type:complete
MSIRADQIKLSKAWNKAVIKKLPVSYKKDGISYVDHTQVTQRLIALIPDVQFKLGCHIYDKYEDLEGRQRKILTGVEYTIEGTIDGHFRSVTEVGMCDKPFDVEGRKPANNGERAKECISDAVKRCGMRLGIGIELYDSSAWLSSYLESPDLIANKPKKEKPKPKPKPKDPVVEKAKVDLEKIIDQKDLDKAVKILEDGVNSNK